MICVYRPTPQIIILKRPSSEDKVDDACGFYKTEKMRSEFWREKGKNRDNL
jgi:hypothetical protein